MSGWDKVQAVLEGERPLVNATLYQEIRRALWERQSAFNVCRRLSVDVVSAVPAGTMPLVMPYRNDLTGILAAVEPEGDWAKDVAAAECNPLSGPPTYGDELNLFTEAGFENPDWHKPYPTSAAGGWLAWASLWTDFIPVLDLLRRVRTWSLSDFIDEELGGRGWTFDEFWAEGGFDLSRLANAQRMKADGTAEEMAPTRLIVWAMFCNPNETNITITMKLSGDGGATFETLGSGTIPPGIIPTTFVKGVSVDPDRWTDESVMRIESSGAMAGNGSDINEQYGYAEFDWSFTA